MRRYRVVVWAVDTYADGEACVGAVTITAPNKRVATKKALDEVWDSRLDSVDCHPVCDVRFLRKDEEE